MERFYYLHYGLALILIFVGLKLAWLNRYWEETFHEHFPIGLSLGVIGVILLISIAASLFFPPREEPSPTAVAQNPEGAHKDKPQP